MIVLHCRVTKSEFAERLRLGTIDRFAATLQPRPRAMQDSGFKLDNRAIAAGADIQDVVTAPTYDSDKPQDVFLYFLFKISPIQPRAVAPGLWIDRCRRFPRFIQNVIGDFVVAHSMKSPWLFHTRPLIRDSGCKA